MDFLFKIWDSNRANKTCVALEENADLYTTLILKASEKLNIDGSTLVLESDGTVVDEDQVLKMLNKETFLLLTKSENWKPPVKEGSFASSSASTETLLLSSSRSSSPASPAPPFRPSGIASSEDASSSRMISPNFWEDFEIPWNQLNRSVIEDCENGKRTASCFNKVVSVTVDSVREVKQFVSTNILKKIATKIVQKYPAQFQDVDEDGVVIGDGCHSLTSKLIDRNNYLNRPHKRPANTVHVEVPPAKRKTILRAKAGCSNWQPPTNSQEPETLKEKKTFLNEQIEKFIFNAETETLLTETFSAQRLFLNGCPLVKDVSAEWPVLLLKEPALLHFKLLMNQDANVFEERFTEKEDKILQLGVTNNFSKINEIPQDPEQKHKICLKVIGDFFKEDIELLIKHVEEADKVPDMMAPCIRVVKNDPDDEHRSSMKYCIFVEKREISELQCDHILESLKFIFVLYYNLNMSYPRGISHILEFLQRYLFKINPDQGSKSTKKSIAKIVSLINKLRAL